MTERSRAVFAASVAVPANPQSFELVQPDGTTLQAHATGDEYQNNIITNDGYTILKSNTGFWTYATQDASGHFVAGDRRVGLDAPPPAALKFQPAHEGQAQSVNASLQNRYHATGTQPLVVLLIQFSNQPPIGTTPSDWQQTLFNTTDSVAAYYKEVSQGRLHLEPAAETSGATNDGIVGWLSLPYPHPNTNTVGPQVRAIAQDAVTAADPYINYASFDTDGNGAVSSSELHIIIIFAGYEGSYSPANKCGNSIWGHRANLADVTTLDNVVLLNTAYDSGYAAVGEWHCTSTNPPGHQATIGPIIHELGHDLGLPDLYDIDNSTYGAGTWSPMALGSWNTVPGRTPGRSPAHHDAFSRVYLGWISPTLVASSQTDLALQPAETSGQALQFIANPNNVDWEFRYQSGQGEYYLVENRQRVGYDAGLPGCGLLIWHVDESAPFSNAANAGEELRLLSLQQADGLDDLRQRANTGDGGDPFPGTSGSSSFGRFTKPSSVLNTGAFSGITMTHILAANPACPASLNLTTQLNESAGLQASASPNMTLSSAAILPAATVDLSVHLSVILEGNAISATPTATPTTPNLNQHVFMPLLRR